MKAISATISIANWSRHRICQINTILKWNQHFFNLDRELACVWLYEVLLIYLIYKFTIIDHKYSYSEAFKLCSICPIEHIQEPIIYMIYMQAPFRYIYFHILSIWPLTKFHMLQRIELICTMIKYDLRVSSYVIIVASVMNNEAKKPFMYLRISITSFSFDWYLIGDPLSLLPTCSQVKTRLEHHEYSTDGFIEREYILMPTFMALCL